MTLTLEQLDALEKLAAGATGTEFHHGHDRLTICALIDAAPALIAAARRDLTVAATVETITAQQMAARPADVLRCTVFLPRAEAEALGGGEAVIASARNEKRLREALQRIVSEGSLESGQRATSGDLCAIAFAALAPEVKP